MTSAQIRLSRVGLLAVGGLLGAVLVAAPLSLSLAQFEISPSLALAKNGGGGGGGGNGGGNGGAAASHDGGRGNGPVGGSPGHGVAQSASDAANAVGGRGNDRGANAGRATNGNAFGHERNVAATGSSASGKNPANHGSIASKLGALNAAHASPTARAHAAPNSRVGLIAAYVDAVERSAELAITAKTLDQTIAALEAELEAPDLTDEERAEIEASLEAAQEKRSQVQAEMESSTKVQSEALAAASNKEVTAEVMAAVNSILGIESGAGGAGSSESDTTTNP